MKLFARKEKLGFPRGRKTESERGGRGEVEKPNRRLQKGERERREIAERKENRGSGWERIFFLRKEG